MPKKRTNKLIKGKYFDWILREREGVFFADGRSNKPSVGRHSLGVRDHDEAIKLISELDLVKAVEIGRADRSLLSPLLPQHLGFSRGREFYEQHVRRPTVLGGARATTSKRYRAVFDKFLPFAKEAGLVAWNQVTRHLLECYTAYLDDEGYAPRTEYLELTTIRQTMKWLAEEGHIPASCLFRLQLKKPEGTDTHCWKHEEALAIIQHCRVHPKLDWLADVFVALVSTGLRISELAGLRWSDLDRKTNVIKLKDEASGRKRKEPTRRTTKSGRDRVLPIHEDFLTVLNRKGWSSSGILFHGLKGGRLRTDKVRNVLIRVLKVLANQFPTPEGEIGFAHGRLHSCRHFFCSRCALEGIPEQVVMSWLGHKDSNMVRHYFHLHNKASQEQMRRLRLLGETGGVDSAGTIPLGGPEPEKGQTEMK